MSFHAPFRPEGQAPDSLHLILVEKSVYTKYSKKQIGAEMLVGGFSPTHLKNMRKSNWIMNPPGFGVKIPKIFELPPPRMSLPIGSHRIYLNDEVELMYPIASYSSHAWYICLHLPYKYINVGRYTLCLMDPIMGYEYLLYNDLLFSGLVFFASSPRRCNKKCLSFWIT